jgi:hypothetical protein
MRTLTRMLAVMLIGGAAHAEEPPASRSLFTVP